MRLLLIGSAATPASCRHPSIRNLTPGGQWTVADRAELQPVQLAVPSVGLFGSAEISAVAEAKSLFASNFFLVPRAILARYRPSSRSHLATLTVRIARDPGLGGLLISKNPEVVYEVEWLCGGSR